MLVLGTIRIKIFCEEHEKRKLHLVRWRRVALPKYLGGLGIMENEV